MGIRGLWGYPRKGGWVGAWHAGKHELGVDQHYYYYNLDLAPWGRGEKGTGAPPGAPRAGPKRCPSPQPALQALGCQPGARCWPRLPFVP